MKKELILTAILAAVAATGCSSQAPVQTKTQAETTEKAQEAVPKMPPEGQKSDASLLAVGFLNLGPAKT